MRESRSSAGRPTRSSRRSDRSASPFERAHTGVSPYSTPSCATGRPTGSARVAAPTPARTSTHSSRRQSIRRTTSPRGTRVSTRRRSRSARRRCARTRRRNPLPSRGAGQASHARGLTTPPGIVMDATGARLRRLEADHPADPEFLRYCGGLPHARYVDVQSFRSVRLWHSSRTPTAGRSGEGVPWTSALSPRVCFDTSRARREPFGEAGFPAPAQGYTVPRPLAGASP